MTSFTSCLLHGFSECTFAVYRYYAIMPIDILNMLFFNGIILFSL